jgi:hypothetical protein
VVAVAAVALLGAATSVGTAAARDKRPDQSGLSLSVSVGPVHVAANVDVPAQPGDTALSASVTSPPASASATVDPSGATVAATTAPASATVSVDTASDPALHADLQVGSAGSASIDASSLQGAATVHVTVKQASGAAKLAAPAPAVAESPAAPIQRPTAPIAPRHVAAPAQAAVAAAPVRHGTAPAPVAVERPAVGGIVHPHARRNAVGAATRHRAPALRSVVWTPHPATPAALAPLPPVRQAPATGPAAAVVQAPAELPKTLDPFGIGAPGSAAAFGFAAAVVAALIAGLVLAAPRFGRWPRPSADLAPQPAFSSPLERPG